MTSPTLPLPTADVRPPAEVVSRPTVGRPSARHACPPQPTGWLAGAGKPAFDRTAAVLLGLLFAPVVLAAAAAVRLTSRGPAFYHQTRAGLGGRPFRIVKLRTMYFDCERRTGPTWATPGDPRVTPVGRFLRRTHLDELPQLVNVLLGHMSLVGPRPERPELIPALEAGVPGYADRLAVRPGVTGLAQLCQPADTDLDSVRRKLAYDRHYIAHAGPWTDLALMAGTAAKMVGLPPLAVCRLFGLGRPPAVPEGRA